MCNLGPFRLTQCTVSLYTHKDVYIDNYVYKYMQPQCTEYIYVYVRVCVYVHIYTVFSAKV